jgi:hypothetical protein
MCSCGEGGGNGRTFALGFTDFPHGNSLAAVLAAWSVIGQDADMASVHFDDGVPWPEALGGLPYNTDYTAELDAKAAAIPHGHLTYLSLTPMNFMRDSLAAYRGTTGGMDLPAPWNTYGFDHPDVITAYLNHCENMIDIFDPDFMTYTIEANILAENNPSAWASYVTLAQNAYPALKGSHPDLPLIITLQADFFHAASSTQTAIISQILPYTDYVGVSTYAFTSGYTPLTLPAEWFSAMSDLAPDKPFAVGETSWPAQTITDPYPVDIPANEEGQADYVTRLLSDAEKLDAVFVNWFFTRDFDDFWESYFKDHPDAALVRIWKDTGLYDGEGNPRTGLDVWHSYLDRKRTGTGLQ